jgi:hypothetical protein
MWIAEPGYCLEIDLRALFSFQPLGDEMASKKLGYKVTVVGAGHNFERDVEETLAAQIISLVMTGGVSVGSGGMSGGIGANTPKAPKSNGGSHEALHVTQVRGSLAGHIKLKKGDKNQNNRFLATAEWLSSRSEDPLTAKAVAQALSDHNQKRLANSPDCLNQNVRKGYCEKRKDGSFFITPEGLEALQGTPAE